MSAAIRNAHWPRKLIDEIGNRYRRGDSAGYLAIMYGVTRNAIIGLMWRHGYSGKTASPVRTARGYR